MEINDIHGIVAICCSCHACITFSLIDATLQVEHNLVFIKGEYWLPSNVIQNFLRRNVDYDERVLAGRKQLTGGEMKNME